jgi:hypothetical protein
MLLLFHSQHISVQIGHRQVIREKCDNDGGIHIRLQCYIEFGNELNFWNFEWINENICVMLTPSFLYISTTNRMQQYKINSDYFLNYFNPFVFYNNFKRLTLLAQLGCWYSRSIIIISGVGLLSPLGTATNSGLLYNIREVSRGCFETPEKRRSLLQPLSLNLWSLLFFRRLCYEHCYCMSDLKHTSSFTLPSLGASLVPIFICFC